MMRTVFHCWIILMDGRNPLRNQVEIANFLKKVKETAFYYGVEILNASVVDNHIHMLLGSEAGPRKIAMFWKSVNTYLALKAKSMGIEGKIFRTKVKYRSISKAFELLRVSRYLLNNGKDDGHFILFSCEKEFRFKDYMIVDIKAWRKYTGLEMDDLKILMEAPSPELGRLAARFEPAFRKRAHLFTVGGKPEMLS